MKNHKKIILSNYSPNMTKVFVIKKVITNLRFIRVSHKMNNILYFFSLLEKKKESTPADVFFLYIKLFILINLKKKPKLYIFLIKKRANKK